MVLLCCKRTTRTNHIYCPPAPVVQAIRSDNGISIHRLVEVTMEQDKCRVHTVPDARGDSTSGDGRPCDPGLPRHIAENGLPNGTLQHSDAGCSSEAPSDRSHASARYAPLRTALSCEENEDELADGESTDDGERNNMESRLCPKYRSCRQRMCGDGFDLEAASSSAASARRVAVGEEEVVRRVEARRSRKRAADCRVKRSNLEAEAASSSDTSNDDYSLGSEDGCIYTYRGGEHLADLPSSFVSLDMGLPRDRHLPAPPAYAPRPGHDPPGEEHRGSRASSPDMDYLEMDFDPGPSCEADSGEESSPEEDLGASPSPELRVHADVRGTTPDAGPAPREPVLEPNLEPIVQVQAVQPACTVADVCEPSTSTAGLLTVQWCMSVAAAAPACDKATEAAVATTPECVSAGALIQHVNARGERLLVRRTCRRWPARPPITHHTSSGDLICEQCSSENVSGESSGQAAAAVDNINLSSAHYHCFMAKKLIVEKTNANFMEEADTSNLAESEAENENAAADGSVCEVERCMIWSEREAAERQVTQIATSACGATAVINVFLALGVPVDVDKINKAVGTRQRANGAPLPRYLLSRAVAGCTAAGLVEGLQQASDGLVTARFFPTYPERVVSLSHWLADWISLGAVPIATLNLQAGVERVGRAEASVPDAWHHQMVFGVSPRGIFLTNPVECVPEGQLWPQLCSDSVLLVRTRDILVRLVPTLDLSPFLAIPDPRWTSFNVLGQVVHLMREQLERGPAESVRSRHVRVPCAYRAGITLAALTGSEAHRRLAHAPHLPLHPHPT